MIGKYWRICSAVVVPQFPVPNLPKLINVLCFILCLISLLSGFGYQEIIFVASILVVRFLPIFLFSMLYNKKFEFYNPGYLYIKTRTGKQIIPLVSKKDTKEVREYFLNKLNIDISDKVNYFM